MMRRVSWRTRYVRPDRLGGSDGGRIEAETPARRHLRFELLAGLKYLAEQYLAVIDPTQGIAVVGTLAERIPRTFSGRRDDR